MGRAVIVEGYLAYKKRHSDSNHRHRQCPVVWSELNAREPSSLQNANQVIWNNKFLCIDKKSVLLKRYCGSRLL